MMANNETGVIQPIQSISQAVKRCDPSILFHTDGTQALGKVSVDLASELSEVDLLSFSAHKFHGPKGVGALFVRDPCTVSQILYGGAQQGGLRPGTENPAALVGMRTALTEMLLQGSRLKVTRALRDKIEAAILAAHHGAFVLGASAQRLPTTANVCLPQVDAEDLVDQLASQGVAISTGSACAHGARKPSHVATALGLTYEQARGCVRISLSIESTAHEVDTFISALGTALLNLKSQEVSTKGMAA
jgi:cysteine desulfurase